MSFDDFLQYINLSFDQYINIIQSGINRATVCLKRYVKEIMINNYSPKIINLMQSNMDIQFILNGYACVAYMVDYINKSQRGMSKLLRQCIEELRKVNHTLQENLNQVANKFINASEVNAQEAAWSLLELSMSRISNIFFPTFSPGERAKILKNNELLKDLPKD
ncbi:uncharacterized protein LOC118192571 [Stegodyphus dumicola]|uniref:uncharacterized protein LOC118192571 n=1 Tax=Stegodyphus dumicola TaxID=202533 RepID=UPI0015B0BDA6|nr:uncharacterized protein LOC118192571 [Stegodyphus dumicola]